MSAQVVKVSDRHLTVTVNEGHGDGDGAPYMSVSGRHWEFIIHGPDSRHVRIEVSRRDGADGARVVKLELQEGVVDAVEDARLPHDDARSLSARLPNHPEDVNDVAGTPAPPAHELGTHAPDDAEDIAVGPDGEAPPAAPAQDLPPVILADDDAPPEPAALNVAVDPPFNATTPNPDDVIDLASHNDLVHAWLTDHPEAGWVSPPHELAHDLRVHLQETATSPDHRRNLFSLSPAILAYISAHGHVAPGRKTWLKRLLGRQSTFRENDTRAVMPDGEQFYEALLQVHLGATGHVHAKPPTMRKVLHERFVLGPSEAFYNVWVARCPGCTWPN
ncbi:unnamed protein product [Peniophora sp. CBMAI 1063]|nr:unnamed protein product [Peniophora sp. CBMAI 1063]